MLRRRKFRLVAVFAALCFLGLCGGSTLMAEPFQTSANLNAQINWLEHELRNARNDEVDILSPRSFAEAEEMVADAKKRLDRGDKHSKIFDKIASAQAELQRAKQVSRRARSELSKVIRARELARAAGATNFEKDYNEVEGKFLDLTKAIEKDKVERARKNGPKVVEEYRTLELRAIKDQTLGQARKLIKQAGKEGAKRTAPKTYAAVQQKLLEVDKFISKNPYQ